jgi:hypothetical protein
MIDDEEGLREFRPQGRSAPADRRHIDGLAAAFTMNKPAVAVVVKKRRGRAEPQGGDDGARGRAPLEERRPRVHQVRTAITRPDPVPVAVVEALPTRRKRARRDPTHAPGAVTRTVFEAAPPMPVAPQAESRPLQHLFLERTEVGYEQVMAELQQLRATLDLALGARRFRIA